MNEQHIINDIRKSIRLETPSRVPCLPLGTDFDVWQGKYSHKEYRTRSDVMIETGLNAIDKFNYDWFILFPDDLLEWEHCGIEVTDEEFIPPAVKRYLEPSIETLKHLRLPSPSKDGRMPFFLEGLKGLRREAGNRVCIAGRIAAPFTAVTLLLGIEPVIFLMLENPILLEKFMDYVSECNTVWAQAQLEAGADILWLGDCVATSKFISAHDYMKFAAEAADRDSKMVRKLGGIVFYHGSETSIPHLKAMADLSFDAINIGETADSGEVKKAIGKQKCIMGNLDTINVLQNGTMEHVEHEVSKLLEAAMPGGGYIFCTGEGIPHNTKPENVRKMTDTVHKHGIYKRNIK